MGIGIRGTFNRYEILLFILNKKKAKSIKLKCFNLIAVLFGHNKALAPPETRSEMARRVFKSYDPDGNNFIPSAVLQNVLFDLDLVNEPPE